MAKNIQRKEPAICRLPVSLTEGRRFALQQLADAHALACERGADVWEFAVELSHLVAAGAHVNDLRWLSAERYAEHAAEVTAPKDSARRFQQSANLGFPAGTCFVATAAGIRAAESLAMLGPSAARSHYCLPLTFAGHAVSDDLAPSWDANRRILRAGDWIVKQFHVPAPSQEMILKAFEEERWPPAIDDPLPPQGDQDPKRRLRSTLESLNRGQENRLLCFRGNGTGERIIWELTAEASSRGAPIQSRRQRAA